MDFAYLNIEYLFLVIYRIFTGKDGGIEALLPSSAPLFWGNFKIASTIISLLLLTGIVYAFIRLRQVREADLETFNRTARATITEKTTGTRRDERWERVLLHANSDNENDWRHAIIEADTILDEIVKRAGFPGETLGERLRGIGKGDLSVVDEAWEAHKVRNRIAHDGAQYRLTKRETLRIIELYRKVFEAFEYL
ncbi:hypothetical protein HYW58_01035 [Candidatus Kaiserbacteria bacterium]|nr:hypothetical protein [Candidatus Kaiserbacteria bacterium]